MSNKSMLGNVVLLKLPPMDNTSRKLFFDTFIKYKDSMCTGCIQDGSPNIIVAIREDNIELQELVKNYFVEEIDVSEIPKVDNWLIGNKLLWPRK